MRNKSGFYIATENDGIFQLTYEDNLFKVLKIIADPDFDFTGIQYLYEDSQSNLWLVFFWKRAHQNELFRLRGVEKY